MKVILIKPVSKLGNTGDIVDVNPGYGRNFLLGNGLAQLASAGAVRMAVAIKARRARVLQKREESKIKVRDTIQSQVILIRATANVEGHLFGGVGEKEIAAAILKRKKLEIDPKRIILPHHLKTLGRHKVMLQLSGAGQVEFIVDVERE